MVETEPVCAACEIGVGGLGWIVFPPADGADFVLPRSFDNARFAAGAWMERATVIAGHCLFQYLIPLSGRNMVRGAPLEACTPKVLDAGW